MISDSKETFVGRLLEEGSSGRSFYSAARKLSSAINTKPWKVTDLYPGKTPDQAGQEILKYFSNVSDTETRPLPVIQHVPGGLPTFTFDSTVKMLKNSKKTDSMVEGDPLPNLIRKFPESFAGPVMTVFNKINGSGVWPKKWKTEHLTIIPKNANPADLSECRNISCTSAFSKILEGQVLKQLREELRPDDNQYGGAPKCGVEHMLVDMWEEALSSMEGGKTAVALLGVDYEKAFNRMEHAECLDQLALLGASPGSLSLIRSFLQGRQMTITLDGHRTPGVPISRGSPQGSVLGCQLYCSTTQNLTARMAGRNDPGRPNIIGAVGPKAFLYVDDTTLLDAVPLSEAKLHITAGQTLEELTELQIEDTFHELNRGAEEIGMKINKKKTQLMVMSPPNGFLTRASIRTGEGVVESQEKLKLVGFTFGSRPGVHDHVESIGEKFRMKIWMLYHLRNAGFKGVTLYRLYCCYIRTIIEFCSAVYHSLLTKSQEDYLEGLHKKAVRVCFGHEKRTGIIMEDNHIESLKARRLRRCDAFIRKAALNPRFKERWFPTREGGPQELRNPRRIQENQATTLRRFNSPLAFMRRRANEMGLR